MIEITNFKIEQINAGVSRELNYRGDSMVPNPEVQVVSLLITDGLTVSEFAGEARVTPQAVRKMIAEDRLFASMAGNQYLIKREELNRYLQNK